MKLFSDIFNRMTDVKIAQQRLPEAKRTLLDAYGYREHADALITQKLAEITRLEALIAAHEQGLAEERAEIKAAMISPTPPK